MSSSEKPFTDVTLPPKQKLFCEEYLIDYNATRAYKAAYKTKNDDTARSNAARLLTNANVKSYLEKKKAALAAKLEITQEMVLEGYRRLAFYDSRKFYKENGELKLITELDEETAFALAGFEIFEEKTTTLKRTKTISQTSKIKMSDRKAALDSICRVLGYYAPEKTDNRNQNTNTNYNSEPLSADKIKQINEALENEY
jgi:phage terminase small subunit